MDYKYHVDIYRSYNNSEDTHTSKWVSFKMAYARFIAGVSQQRNTECFDSWSVTLYDCEANEIKLCITDTDFSD